jgi:hypothetical protein
VANGTVPLGTWLEPDVAKRLRLTAAIRGGHVWRLVNDSLKKTLPELPELVGELQETEIAS